VAPLGLPAIGFINWATPGRVMTASSTLGTLSASNLLTDDITQRWQPLLDGSADWVQVDLGGVTPLGYAALIATGLGAASTVRIRIGTTSGGGDGYDSGSIPAGVDPAYGGLLATFRPAEVNGRYVRFDVPDGVYAGRIAAGPLLRLSAGYLPFRPVWQPRSSVQEARGGQWYINARRPRRGWRLSFPAVALEQIWGTVAGGLATMAEVCADHTDVLFCRDLASANPSRDTIWGIASDLVELDQSHPDFMGAELTIWERI
jgi:hypothetical protein